MDAKLITEFTLLSQRFAEEKQTNGNLAFQLAALDRDEQGINRALKYRSIFNPTFFHG